MAAKFVRREADIMNNKKVNGGIIRPLIIVRRGNVFYAPDKTIFVYAKNSIFHHLISIIITAFEH
jgi:hypothetical protein